MPRRVIPTGDHPASLPVQAACVWERSRITSTNSHHTLGAETPIGHHRKSWSRIIPDCLRCCQQHRLWSCWLGGHASRPTPSSPSWSVARYHKSHTGWAVGLPIKSMEIRFGFSRFPYGQTAAPRTLLHVLRQRFVTHAVAFGSPIAVSIIHAIMDDGLGRAVLVHRVLEPIYYMSISYYEGVSHHQPYVEAVPPRPDLTEKLISVFIATWVYCRHHVYKRQFETKTLHHRS